MKPIHKYSPAFLNFAVYVDYKCRNVNQEAHYTGTNKMGKGI